jgi:hypothetical protein
MCKRITVEFNGYIEVDKDDMVVNTINDSTGKFEPVDTKQYTEEELLDGFRVGHFYLDFKATYEKALDGEENYDFSIED